MTATNTLAPTRGGHSGAAVPPPRDSSTGPAVRDTAWTAAVWGLLVVLCGALFLDGLDVSMVGVALPSIGSDLHMTPSALQWIVSGYVLGYGGLLLLGGRVSDLLGRRPVFLVAVGVFGAASVLGSLMSDPATLIALRFVKGAAAAFTVPAGLSIITTTFAEGPARSRALSIYTVCGASGFSMGLVFGGALTELGWRATFLLPGPVAIALVLVGMRVIPRAAHDDAREPFRLAHFDLVGALASTGALLVLVYAVVTAPNRGWGSPGTIGLLALTVLLGIAFVALERRHPRPLVRLGILRSRGLVHANVSGAVMFGGYVAFQFLATIYLQDALGWSPLAMALAFLPGGLIVVASASKMDAVLERVDTARLILAGLVAFLVGYLLFLRVEPGMAYWSFLLPTMLFLGLGFALTFPAVNTQATQGVSDDEQGLAAGLVNTSIQIGGAVVLAVVTAVIGGGSGATIRHDALLPNMVPALTVVAGVAVLGVAGTLVRVLLGRRGDTEAGAESVAVLEPAPVAVPAAVAVTAAVTEPADEPELCPTC